MGQGLLSVSENSEKSSSRIKDFTLSIPAGGCELDGTPSSVCFGTAGIKSLEAAMQAVEQARIIFPKAPPFWL